MGRAKEIIVKVIPSKIANEFVKKHHYSGKVANNSSLHFGCFLDDKLHGVLSYGSPLDKSKVLPLVDSGDKTKNEKWNEMLELNRMAFDDYLPKYSESRCIAISIKLIKKNAPQIKWLLSFSDGTQCGDGTIYRASGFILTQIKMSENDLWELPNELSHLSKGKPTVHRITIQCGTSLISKWVMNKYNRFTIPLEQLQKEHQELGKKIQELNDSINKPKDFEVGRWYKWKGPGEAMFNYEGINEFGMALGYGISECTWSQTPWVSDFNNWYPATEQEVKDALIKEAERRGYKEGVVIKSFICGYSGFKDNGLIESSNGRLTEFYYKGSLVMKDGQWATIIKDDVISIGGYKVVFAESRWKNKYTSIDGNDFFIDFWQAAKLISEHSKAKVMIGCSKQFDVSLETINKILDKLK